MVKRLVILKNVPKIADIDNLIKILKYLNVKVNFNKNKLKINSKNIVYKSLNIAHVSKLRASYYLIPIMLILFNKCEIALPGGCNIGERKIDEHIRIFEECGYSVKLIDNVLNIRFDKKIDSLNFCLIKQSVGATINAIIMSLKFTDVILNGLVIEPEARCLVNFLKQLGYNLIITNKELVYHRNKNTNISKKIQFNIIPDRIETITYLCFGLLYGKVKVKNICYNDVKSVLDVLTNNDYKIKVKKKSIISYKSKGKCFNVSTGIYPLIPTDLQPILGVLLSKGRGSCVISENIFSSRMKIYEELNRLGATINIVKNKAYVIGSNYNNHACFKAYDLREGMALILAVIESGGIIYNIDVVLRGYDLLFKKLSSLGILFRVKNHEYE